MVLVTHDFKDRIIRFETQDKIIWRGLVHEFTDEIAIMILKEYGTININNIWNVKLWKLIQLYHMFIEKIKGKIDFNNGIATDFNNKIKYIFVTDTENIEIDLTKSNTTSNSVGIDNNYNNILLLYTPYELSKTLENRLIKSDLTLHFIST